MFFPSVRQTDYIMVTESVVRKEVVTMTVTIERASAAELRERLNRVLANVDMDYVELADLAGRYMLTPEELAAWDEVRAIRFLLGDE